MKWISWIPTMAGRLSFSNIGSTDNGNKIISLNAESKCIRFYLLHQKRNLNDSVLPSFLVRMFYGLETNFWFSLVGCCNNQFCSSSSDFKGKVFVFINKKPERQWRTFEKNIYNPIKLEIEQNRQNITQAEADKKIDALSAQAKELSIAIFSFSINREGIIRLSLEHVEEQKKSELEILSAQTYYFLKDITHTHQHHHPKSDSIINLYPSADGNVNWQFDICRVLFRRILHFKHDTSIDTYDTALGLLPYAKCFSETINKSGTDYYKDISDIEINYELVEKSITTKRDQLIHKNQKIIWKTETLYATFFIVIGLIISCIGLASLLEGGVSIRKDSTLYNFIIELIEYPIAWFFIAILLSVIITEFRHSPKDRKIIKALPKILITLPKILATAIIFLFLVFFLSYCVIFSLKTVELINQLSSGGLIGTGI